MTHPRKKKSHSYYSAATSCYSSTQQALPESQPQNTSLQADIESLSDFPTLSGGPRPQPNTSNAASWNTSAIRQPPSQQQPQTHQSQQRAPSAAPSQQSLDQFDGQRSQQPSADRAGGGDDFPPLGGQVNGDTLGHASGFGSPDAQQALSNSQQSQLPIREGNKLFSQSQQPPIGQQNPSTQQPSKQHSQPTPASGVKKYADMTDKEKWGLQGLLAAFEARKQVEAGGQPDDTLPPVMRSAVVHGFDLSSLGLDLDSSEPLYPTFTPFPAVGSSASTFDFHDRHTVPAFTLPSAYTVTNVPPLNNRMSAFSDETLFFIFYQNPRDVTQELAAQELMNREWRWHKVLHQWLQKDIRESNGGSSLPLIDMTSGAPPGIQPVRKSERVESGVYVFFDAMNWRRERRYLDLDYDQLDTPRVAPMPNGNGPALGGPGRVGSDMAQQGGVGSSQVPSA